VLILAVVIIVLLLAVCTALLGTMREVALLEGKVTAFTDPDGALGAVRSTQSAARSDSYNKLFSVAVRELNEAIQLLRD
jgi:hypothetical protein